MDQVNNQRSEEQLTSFVLLWCFVTSFVLLWCFVFIWGNVVVHVL